MKDILQNNPEKICKEILTMLGNENVNVQLDNNNKSSMYVFLNNTMYISNKTDNKKSIDEQNKSKIIVIAHECAHSIQAKYLQILNFLLANLEIILFAIVLVSSIFLKKSSILLNGYIIVSFLSIIIRWYLEMNATINSVKITARYMIKNNVQKESVKDLIGFYKGKLLKTLPIFLLWLFLFKVLRLVLAIVI